MHYRTEKGYPLSIEVTTIRCEQQSSPDKEFLLNLLPKVNYPALLKAVQDLSPHCGNNEIPALPELPETLDVLDNLDDKGKSALVLFYVISCFKITLIWTLSLPLFDCL